MTYLTRINLVKQVEEVLEEYSGHFFQGFFKTPQRKEQLINEVISELPNSYCVIDQDATTETNRVHCWALEQRLTVEMLIRECMNKIFLKSRQEDNFPVKPPQKQSIEEQPDKEPSHWFG